MKRSEGIACFSPAQAADHEAAKAGHYNYDLPSGGLSCVGGL